jgi:hypothetical protein
MWPEIKKEMEAQIGEQAAMLPMDAGANPMENPAVMWFLDGAMRDGRAMVFGAKTGNKGLGLDMAVNFNDGSYMGKMFASGGKTSELMGKLPAGAYLLAGAIDTSSASIKQFIRDLSEKAMKPGAEAPMSVKTFEASEGQAFVMGLPRGGLIGGMMTGVIGYAKAKDTDAYVAAFKADMMAKDGDTEQGVTYKSSYVADGAKVGEVDVDVWDVKLTPDGSNAGAAQAMAMMFGPAGGPNGYVAQVDGGVYTTFSKSSELMGTALKTGKGEGENLGSDKLIGQVAQSLPGSRLAEGYLGMKGILDLVLPFAAMAGVQVPAEKIPENLPPVGMAISGQGGAAHFALFMPAPVIKAAVDIAMTVQGQMEGDMEEDEEVPAGGKGGTGQPRF